MTSLANKFNRPDASGNNILSLTSSEWSINGTAVTAAAADLNNVAGINGNAVGSTTSGQKIVAANHTVTSGEATATTFTQVTGLTTISSAIVQIIRANKVITGDATITFATGSLTVANGSTYTLTASDIVRYIVWGV